MYSSSTIHAMGFSIDGGDVGAEDSEGDGANGSDPERDEVEANENNVEEDKEVSVDVRLRKADFL